MRRARAGSEQHHCVERFPMFIPALVVLEAYPKPVAYALLSIAGHDLDGLQEATVFVAFALDLDAVISLAHVELGDATCDQRWKRSSAPSQRKYNANDES